MFNKDTQPQSCARNLRALREYSGMTVDQVAAKSGVSTASITKFENGHAVPSWQLAWKLADCYDVPIDVIVGRTAVSVEKTLSMAV